MKWYLEVLKKYAVFRGRARRKEYWYFVLFSSLIYFGLAMIDVVAGFSDLITDGGPLSTLYYLAVILPEVAVAARRLHDTAHSGWWQLMVVPIMVVQWFQDSIHEEWLLLLVVITLLGILPPLLWMVRDSDPGENRWGPNPKEELQAMDAVSDTA